MKTEAGQILEDLRTDALAEVTNNILPFWQNRMPDNMKGGFYGRIDGKNNIINDAPKGAILNARILWTFSAAFRILKDISYLDTAKRARDYIMAYFFDKEYGGTFWVLNSNGSQLDAKKQIYSQAFTIYALSEYYMAIGDESCKDKAVELFHLIEKHSFDRGFNGYLEAFDRKWGYLEDLRLSEKDANEKKTMNTHLHILEAYTNLYRIWPDKSLRSQLVNMVMIFLEKILDQRSHHLNLFFDERWNSKSTIISYGHDIEASWLIYEAAEVLEDKGLINKVKVIATEVVRAAMEGLQPDGSLIYERDDATGHLDMDRHWWVQSETVVGFINAWQLTGDESYLGNALRCFNFIKGHLIDRENGEWYWSIRRDGTVNTVDDKAGFWKCPYHNSRMCLEIMSRVRKEGQGA